MTDSTAQNAARNILVITAPQCDVRLAMSNANGVPSRWRSLTLWQRSGFHKTAVRGGSLASRQEAHCPANFAGAFTPD
jgi:hypothetical protein